MSQQQLPESGSVQYITIERVSNGFLITCPENMNDNESCKYIKQTMNGVVSFMEHIWKVSVIQTDKPEPQKELPTPVRRKK